MIAALLLLATAVPPVQLHRTETGRAGSPPFDLVPAELREAEIAACRLEETIPMGTGVAEKRTCPGRLGGEPLRQRCRRPRATTRCRKA